MPGNNPEPIIHILHGDDDYAMGRYVQNLTASLIDPGQSDMNITHLDGKQATLDDISTAAATLSFFDSSRRLVLLSNPLSKYGRDKKARESFLKLLISLPPSTCLVLLVNDIKDHGDWKIIPQKKSHWILDWVQTTKGLAVYRRFESPPQKDMPAFIIQQVKDLKGAISPRAASALAAHTGNNTRLAWQEVNKLLTYADFKRPIEVEDVEKLCVGAAAVSIFDLTDALGEGRREKAMRLLHTLLEQEEAFMIFSMVAAHFRTLLLAREILDEGSSANVVAKELGKPDFVADRLCKQAMRFKFSELEALFLRLCESDLAIKTGGLTVELALELFVAGLEKAVP